MVMARGRTTKILITAGGVLLLLSHAAAWQLGRRAHGASTSTASAAASSTQAHGDSGSSLADLVRAGREHEAAEQLKRAAANRPWPEEIAAARAALPADADIPALVRTGIATANGNREGPSAETAAAFGRWLELDPDAAIDFIGRGRGNWRAYALQCEMGRWLGEGNQHRLDGLTKRFPRSWQTLVESAQILCKDRGPDFAVELASSLQERAYRMFLLTDCLPPEQWRGHLAKVPALFPEPQDACYFLDALMGKEGADVLLDEIRGAGFPPDVLAKLDASQAKRQEYARNRAREKEEDEKRRAANARPPTPLEQQLSEAAEGGTGGDSDSLEKKLEKVVPGFAEACADLQDGRLSMAEVLAQVQKAWPPASDAEVTRELRGLLFRSAFAADPLGTLQAAGEDFNDEAASGLNQLTPEMMVRVVTAHPGLLQGEEGEDYGWLCEHALDEWRAVDPEGCREALQRIPDEVLRTQWLRQFDASEEREKEGGGR